MLYQHTRQALEFKKTKLLKRLFEERLHRQTKYEITEYINRLTTTELEHLLKKYNIK
jgi:hypothetical protein